MNREQKLWFTAGAMLAGMACATFVVVTGYRLNSRVTYLDGVLVWLVLLVIGKILWRRSGAYQVAANTLILFMLILPVVDLFYSPPERTPPLALSRGSMATNRCYSFEAAQGDPAQFRSWWKHFVREWLSLKRYLQESDPEQGLPFKLKANSQIQFLSSVVKINSLGFRDEEFERAKTNQLRIIAIGESTTAGVTIEPDDLPWPKVLERIIAQRLNPGRPVQVINAGVWAYTLEENLMRLDREFLPLQPDVIISYHGYNGFQFLDESLAPIRIGPQPEYQERPSPLLAECEYRWRQWWHRRLLTRRWLRPVELDQFKQTVLDSRYAKLYRALISWCGTNHIDLALCTFNMAVNEQSPPQVVAFYRGGFPNVNLEIKANRLHNYLLSQLARESLPMTLIDSSAELDGVWSKYIDLVHFTQEGRDQLAENIFGGLRPMLIRKLAPYVAEEARE